MERSRCNATRQTHFHLIPGPYVHHTLTQTLTQTLAQTLALAYTLAHTSLGKTGKNYVEGMLDASYITAFAPGWYA